MRSLRRFLSPGWVIGLLAVVVFAWACFALLAPWQLGKSGDLEARNSQLEESFQAEPAPLAQVIDRPDGFVEREWRLVTVSGRWVPDSEALLRLRAVDGEPVYQVLTVFDPVDGPDLLVNRGHVPVGENNTVPDYPVAPAGQVDITARVRATEAGLAEPVLVDGRQTVRVVDPVVLGDTLGHTLESQGYLQLSGGQPGSLSPAPVPAIENGPYLSYGLQWLLFGVLAPVALVYFAWAEIRARRRDAEDEVVDSAAEGMSGRDASGDDTRGDGGGVAIDGTTGGRSPDVLEDEIHARERVMRARYGERDDAEHRRAYKRANRLLN
ncbi:SURF1 family protein [Rhodococcus sp. IEGM 1408]|uniref:SURF1 family cytochrome oxidase biogenesis protein n=1 Tax=Rhodococcus sp. IEGM 1408 TaxID=3082220 RepID=UPI002952C23A|nr:SURF1 family cytochrome oxidase biogenesis protein [Rhodococcus sp. IEGM 1408]MDV8001926.1 SURF1 family cytochrome oxidase biogenesis protein [Rhodococcus sp. IEGM 1408]